MTHFKLNVDGGLSRRYLFELLDAMNGCLVENLVLDGIRYAQPDLLAKIAQALPELRGLTLIYRACDLQLTANFIEWPLPSWEYASHFSAFKKLQYFG